MKNPGWLGVSAATFLLALAGLPALLGAQQQQPAGLLAGPPLALDDALELAAQHNPAYRRAINQMSLSGPQSRSAWGGFLPTLSLSGGTSYGFNERSIGVDDFGNPIPNPQVQRLWNSGSQQGLQFGLTLFEGGGRFHELGRTRAAAEANTWQSRAALVQTEAEIKRQFFAARLQSDLMEVEQELVEARRADLQATERLFQIAAANQSDVLGAQLDVQVGERELQAAQAERAKALVALKAVIGDGALDVNALAPEPLPLFDPAGLEVATLVSAALASRPSLQQRAAEVSAAAAAESQARSGRWPTIRLGGGYTRAASGLERDFLFDFNPDAAKYGSVSLSVDIPLFSGFQTSYRIADAQVAHDNAQETLREARLETERDVRQALIDLDTRYRQLELRGAERDLADRRLELMREEYRLATRSFTELQDVIRTAATTRRQEVQARYEFVNALIALEERVGHPVTPEGN